MPEELVIALIVLIGAIWLLYKIAQAVQAALDQASKNFNEAASRRKARRIAKMRGRFNHYVHWVIPDELDNFEKRLQVVRSEFEQAQKLTKWVAGPPEWKKEEFRPVTSPHKSSDYSEMKIEDIEDILTPSPDSSTWCAQESEIINRHCKYPTKAPVTQYHKLTAFQTMSSELKRADFDFDATQIRKQDVDRYFADEQSKILAYNNRRSLLIDKTAELNSAIEKWNGENQISWQAYVTESKKMEEAAQVAFQKIAAQYTTACKDEVDCFKRLLNGFKRGEKQSVLERLNLVLDSVQFPQSVPHTWDIDFDDEQQIAVIDVGLPDVVHQPIYKTAILKYRAAKKPLNQAERKELVPKVHPAILLRIAYEIFRNDAGGAVKLLVVNGWVRFDDPATGVKTKAYTASLMVGREQVIGLNLSKVDPMVAFHNLHGKSAGKLAEIIPIEPILSLNRKDARFVNAREVLNALGTEANLAAMDWQDFEHLIRELFEKEFCRSGTEVKITQASRDRGVDAIVFDPDPIHGGKFVIQAKRYTNTVEVSAVRDLCAVVKKEGASRGILVTTSTYGADAYAFANNEPVTLLNGAELLGLLKRHGYAFRINLQEARQML